MNQAFTQNNKRIAKNTLLLYFRMIITMLISLYTSRVVLNTLGVEDFGIYNVVGGIVAMLGFLNGSMTTTTQRFITFELGCGNSKNLKLLFNTCQLILGMMSILIIIVAETVGLWFLWNKMQIPLDRMDAAFWVYQCSILASVISVMSVPYNATIIAHERMGAFAYISILEVILKLVIVYLLVAFSVDKLILYAFLTVAVQLLIRVIYSFYCNRHFEETKLMFVFSKFLLNKMLWFTGWNLFGNLAYVTFSSGLNILLNVFFGPVVNAARGISVLVQGTVMQFSSNFQMAINPQITKLYASEDYQSMYRLIERSSKFTFFLLLLICLPVVLETEIILTVWLKTVPDYTVTFVRLMLCTSMIDTLSNPLMVAATATGNVKVYQSVVGGILLAILPISYIVLKLGGSPSSVFIVHFIISILAFISRVYIVHKLINLNIKDFILNVVCRCLLVLLLAVPLPIILKCYTEESWLSFCGICLLCVVVVVTISFYVGFDNSEKKFAKSKALYLINKVRK